MSEKRFSFLDGFSLRYTCICDNQKGYRTNGVLKQDEVLEMLNALYEENKQLKGRIQEYEEIKKKGLDVLGFYQEKLKNTTNHDDFQSVRDEIWIVKQVLLEMGVMNE